MEPAKILVIEDDYIVARTIERSLQSEEFAVSIASRGDKGLQLAHLNPPDLVILDIIMPDMNGYTVCEQLRTDPVSAHVPILFLTAKVKPQDRIEGLTAGADDYLCKPFNLDELILRVRAILRRTRPNNNKPSKAVPRPAHSLVVGDYMLDTSTFFQHFPLYLLNNDKVSLAELRRVLMTGIWNITSSCWVTTIGWGLS